MPSPDLGSANTRLVTSSFTWRKRDNLFNGLSHFIISVWCVAQTLHNLERVKWIQKQSTSSHFYTNCKCNCTVTKKNVRRVITIFLYKFGMRNKISRGRNVHMVYENFVKIFWRLHETIAIFLPKFGVKDKISKGRNMLVVYESFVKTSWSHCNIFIQVWDER